MNNLENISLEQEFCNIPVNKNLSEQQKYVQEGIINILNLYMAFFKSGSYLVDPDTFCEKEIGEKTRSLYLEFIVV